MILEMILISVVSIIIIFLTRKVSLKFMHHSLLTGVNIRKIINTIILSVRMYQIDVNDSTSTDSYYDVLYDNTTTNIKVNGLSIHIDRSEEQCGYRAVKENVPRNFVAAALSDPL
jgi:hypothetical protein